MVLIAARDSSCEEALGPTATFQTIDLLTPVRPACSEPIALIKIKARMLWIVSAADRGRITGNSEVKNMA